MQLIYMLLGGLISAAPTLVGRVLISLGIAYVSYSGIDTMITGAKADLIQRLGLLPPLALQLVGVLQVGTAANIMCSAALAKLTLMGLQSGVLTRMVNR